jgi:hypothetical protein
MRECLTAGGHDGLLKLWMCLDLEESNMMEEERFRAEASTTKPR